MADALDAKFIDTIVKNPLGTEILARYALKDDLAILEMSSASGLTLINPDERNPLKTSTFGFGQMIKDAINKCANGRMVKQLDDRLKHFAGLVNERWRANLLCSPNLYQTSLSFLSLQAVLV